MSSQNAALTTCGYLPSERLVTYAALGSLIHEALATSEHLRLPDPPTRATSIDRTGWPEVLVRLATSTGGDPSTSHP